MKRRRNMEVGPVQVAEISRRARRERSEVVWRMLQSIFSNGIDEKGPMLREIPKAQPCQ